MVGIRFGGSRDEILMLMQRLGVITPPTIKGFLVNEIANGVDVFLSSSSNISSCLKCECLSNRNQNFLVLGEGITTGGPTEPWFLEVDFDQQIAIFFGSNYCLTNIIQAISSDLRLQAARGCRDGFKGGDKLRV